MMNMSDTFDVNHVQDILDHINQLDDTNLSKDLQCLKSKHLNDKIYNNACDIDWDTLSCWPQTLPGTLSKIPCFDQLYGIKYDSSRE